MQTYSPLVQEATPCPRCGSRHLLVVAYTTASYEQDVEVRPDGSVVALSEYFQAYEEWTGDATFQCLRCEYQWD